MSMEIPAEVSEAGLDDWFSGLDDLNRFKVQRYLGGIDSSSKRAFFIDLMSRAQEDHNYRFCADIGSYARGLYADPYDRFVVTEGYIEGLYGAERYGDAEEACCENLELFPRIKERLMRENGGELPGRISCRNRLIDVMVGVDGEYDNAVEVLEKFSEMGIMDPDELGYRKQSLKIHRLQKTFDTVFIYRPKQG